MKKIFLIAIASFSVLAEEGPVYNFNFYNSESKKPVTKSFSAEGKQLERESEDSETNEVQEESHQNEEGLLKKAHPYRSKHHHYLFSRF